MGLATSPQRGREMDEPARHWMLDLAGALLSVFGLYIAWRVAASAVLLAERMGW